VRPQDLRAERRVNRAILAAEAGAVGPAVAAARAALRIDPRHKEALKQLGLLQANVLGRLGAAAATFRRLRAQLSGPAAAEIDDVIVRLESARPR
jgi:hypothetical protein